MFRCGFLNGYDGILGAGWLHMLIPVLFIGLLVFIIIRVSSGGTNRYNGNFRSSSRAVEILNKRFANGEIDEQEYNSKKNLLE